MIRGCVDARRPSMPRMEQTCTCITRGPGTFEQKAFETIISSASKLIPFGIGYPIMRLHISTYFACRRRSSLASRVGFLGQRGAAQYEENKGLRLGLFGRLLPFVPGNSAAHGRRQGRWPPCSPPPFLFSSPYPFPSLSPSPPLPSPPPPPHLLPPPLASERHSWPRAQESQRLRSSLNCVDQRAPSRRTGGGSSPFTPFVRGPSWAKTSLLTFHKNVLNFLS